MKVIKWILKFVGGIVLLTLLSVVAVYLTLDISTLAPSIERIVKHNTGAETKLSELTWLSFDTLGLGQAKLTWPLSAEEEEAWEAYRAAKREKKNDENVELPPRPLPALSVCATDVSVKVDLLELTQGGIRGKACTQERDLQVHLQVRTPQNRFKGKYLIAPISLESSRVRGRYLVASRPCST